MPDSIDTNHNSPECDFTADDLNINPSYYNQNGALTSWECSRPVWDQADGQRCIWHANASNKSQAELLNTVADADLSGAILTETDLSNAKITNADLIDAYLNNANFTDADLRYADFTDAGLRYVKFTDADLRYVKFTHADLTDADLPGAFLYKTNLTDAHLHKADFTGASLHNADLTDADLTDADLQDTNLTNADFTGANLTNADFTDANLTNANLTDANLTNADFTDANLKEAVLLGANLKDAEFASTVDLRETLLPESVLFGSLHSEIDADLREAPVGDLFKIRGGNPATLIEADLGRADLEDADLGFTDLREATLTSTDCENTQFDEANLNRATLENADLTSADFSQAYLYQTRLDGAQISDETQFNPDGDVGDRTTPNACRYDSKILPSSAAASIENQANRNINAEEVRARRARSTYSRLENLANENGFPDFKSEMFIRRQEARRELLFAQGQWLKGGFAHLQKLLFNYGESFGRILTVSAVIVTLFWGLFLTTGLFETVNGELIVPANVRENPGLIWDTFYHSISVFFAGSGPLTPTGRVGELLIAAERVAGPILLALLIFVLGRRAAR